MVVAEVVGAGDGVGDVEAGAGREGAGRGGGGDGGGAPASEGREHLGRGLSVRRGLGAMACD